MAEDKNRMLVVVAHPDDETFGCGSLIAHATARGVTTVVACATRGEAGSPTAGRGLEDADMADVREGEPHEAAGVLGVDRVMLFDWIDSGMDSEPAPAALTAAPVEAVEDTITDLIDEIRPTVGMTLNASDGHRDHAHICDATLLAVAGASKRPDRGYLHCLGVC